MYESQTHSKNNRQLLKALDRYFNTDKLYDQLYSKHVKKRYAGKPTRKYLRLMKKIEKAESYNLNDFTKFE